VTSPLAKLTRRVSDLEKQVRSLQFGQTIGGGNTTQYSQNVITNGDIESGVTGWARSFFTGTIGTVSVETTAPIDGLDSLKISEAASSSTRITWLPSGSSTNPTVNTDVFPTAPGDVWLITAQMQATVATTHAKIYAFCGATPANCYALPSAGITVAVAAADIPLTANVVSTLQGTITVPASMNFLTFNCSPDDAAGTPAAPWSWLLDTVSLQLKVN
jgi:hypothetical protein